MPVLFGSTALNPEPTNTVRGGSITDGGDSYDFKFNNRDVKVEGHG
jgi:hypothetical protein